MIRQSPARIYKSQQRGHTENENQRLLSTFNFEGYHDETRAPFGSLLALNDETLAPGFTIKREPAEDTLTVMIPLVGGLEYTTAHGTFHAIPGEATFISNIAVSISNPYESELVNFLFIQFENTAIAPQTAAINLGIRNILHPFMDIEGISGFMGLFNGREEALYPLKSPANGLFVFVVNGAFEVQGRLLEERDGLALWDTVEADMEALSENAIILLFEVPLTGFTA